MALPWPRRYAEGLIRLNTSEYGGRPSPASKR